MAKWTIIRISNDCNWVSLILSSLFFPFLSLSLYRFFSLCRLFVCNGNYYCVLLLFFLLKCFHLCLRVSECIQLFVSLQKSLQTYWCWPISWPLCVIFNKLEIVNFSDPFIEIVREKQRYDSAFGLLLAVDFAKWFPLFFYSMSTWPLVVCSYLSFIHSLALSFSRSLAHSHSFNLSLYRLLIFCNLTAPNN